MPFQKSSAQLPTHPCKSRQLVADACWQKWTYRRHIELCQSTLQTKDSWQYSGRGQHLWILYSRLAYYLYPRYFLPSMMWILHEKGVKRALHYLDHFLIVGQPNSRECHIALASTSSIYKALGFPVVPDKTEGPITHFPSFPGYRDRHGGQPASPTPGQVNSLALHNLEVDSL